ncbi:lyase [Ascochyta rabiei]|uniref:Lyase n=1 Tax=Didymella rabiei TaxID=5454 RepID=A0A163GGV1_DIDRA|nr:lyase [Ascochyta rabiei]
MKFFAVAALASLAHLASAVSVVGQAEGFAKGVTGGGSATPQCPKDIKELSSWLTDSTARIIVKETVTYYKAAKTPIKVGSNKTVLGIRSKGIVNGKVSDMSHKYDWDGDALSFAGADLIWVDHVTSGRPGRQHCVFGSTPSTRITLTSNFINGASDCSTG